MARYRPVVPLALSEETRKEVETLSRSRFLPHALVRRARIIFLAAEGMSHEDIGRKVGVSRAMVGMWRKRFLKQGLMGLYAEQRPGGASFHQRCTGESSYPQDTQKQACRWHSLELSFDCR